jgi:hypothetical protein
MKHPAEFEITQTRLDAVQFTRYFIEGCRVVFSRSQFQQLTHICQQRFDRFEIGDDPLERCTLAAQRLGPLGLFPDIALGEFEFYLFETVFTVGEVKDTPEALRCASSDP